MRINSTINSWGGNVVETVRTIKGYEIHERIGSGGFGVVHRAYQATIGREVAIKIILPHFANQPDFIRRFETEAQIVARLEHPFIVPLYDYWRDPEGAYLVMRYLRGGNLREALANSAFGLEAAAAFLDQIASALAMAHRNGIVHRDLKPSNILLDEDGNTYLSDFGIAKDTGKTEGTLTGSGMVLGSPDYLSPEQARSEAVTPRTDMYSLGVVLYEALTGQHPFPNMSSVERMYKHINEPLPLIDTLPPEATEGINAIIQRATAKNPAQRYTDVLEIAAAFRREADLSKRSPESIVEQLTLREQEILRMIVDGCSNKQIADQLFIAIGTVKWHVKQLYQKLRVRSRVQAIMRARELNLIVPRMSAALTEAGTGESTYAYAGLPAPENPYKGLRAFQTADARDFFGRERLVQRLIKRLGEHDELARFLAVVGPSGSGKSSVVKAGLIPALWRGDLPGSERWFVIEMLPGVRPLDELEIALTRVAANQAGNLREQLERDSHGLLRVAALILPDDGSDLVVIVDQFEEIFTLVEDEARRVQFLDLLHTAVTDPRSRVRVIITLRADFYDRPLNYPEFGELVRSLMETIMPLSADELEEAITKPAARVGVAFEPGLVATITGDVHYQPGALPLLQYALTELFEQRADRTLTHDAYQALGGATGALAKRAEDLYDEQPETGRETLRQMFLRLVTLGEGSEDTRRRVLRAELLAVGGNEDLMDEVIDTYAAYRLLTLDHDPTTRRPTVEIAHEALLREWDRLRAWLNESRHDIRQQRLLGTAAAEWQQANREPSYLLHGARLDQFAGWAAETKLALTQEERAYLDASTAEHRRQEDAERERQARELELAQQAVESAQQAVESAQQAERSQRSAANRLRYLVVGLTFFLAVAIVAVIAIQRQAAVNHSLVLASDAQQAYSGGKTDLALALALEATRIDQPPQETIRALSTVALGMGTRALLRNQGNVIKAVAFSADSKTALSGGCATLAKDSCTAGEVVVWDVGTAAQKRSLSGHTGWVTSITADPANPHWAISASEDKTLILWNVETGELIRRFQGHTASANSVVFGADGKTALSGSDDHTAILWDVATGQIVRRFEGHTDAITSVAFSPDGQTAATGSADRSVLLWKVSTGEVVRKLTEPTARILGVNFRIDDQGQTLVFAISFDNIYREWNTDTGTLTRNESVSSASIGYPLSSDGRTALNCGGNECGLVSVSSWTVGNFMFLPSRKVITASAISADGHFVLMASESGELALVNTPASGEIRRFHAEGGLVTVDVSPDGRYLLTGSYSRGTVILLDLQTGQEVRRLKGLEPFVGPVKFSPDGRQALIGSCDVIGGTAARKLVLWDVQTGQVIHELKGYKFYPRAMAFSPDGRTALTGTMQWGPAWKEQNNGEIILWDLTTGQEIRRFVPTMNVFDISFTADGRQAITGTGPAGSVTLWDVQTGQAIRQFDYMSAALSFTADSRYFVTGTPGGSLVLLDAETGAPVRYFRGLSGVFWSLDLSPDGKYLIAGADRGIVLRWDFQTGDEVQRFYGPGANSWNVVYSPDGQTLFSTTPDPNEDVIQWRVADWSLDELRTWVSKNRYVRDFTCEERTQYRIEPYCR
jgi:WD40 repeat protein/serine/threonine protein kinase